MSEAVTLSDADIARLADAVARRVTAPETLPRIGVTIEEVQQMLGCPSKWSAHQEIKRLGLKTYSRGKYRIRDIDNAVARRTRA